MLIPTHWGITCTYTYHLLRVCFRTITLAYMLRICIRDYYSRNVVVLFLLCYTGYDGQPPVEVIL